MKILHVMAAKGNGGAEIYSTDVILGLHQAGFEQCVVMRETAPRRVELAEKGVRIVSHVFDAPLQFLQRRAMARLIVREEPTIVQCWMRRAAAITPGSRRSARPIVGWFGDYKDVRHFSHCTDFVAVTQDIVDSLRKGGVPADRTRYISTFPSVADAPPIDRASLDTPADATVLLTLARLDPVKALDTMLRAVKALPGVYLWIAGEGPSREGLERLAQQLDLGSRVRFLGWRTDRGALLKAADICVLPSRYEPFGTVILEAWSMRVPLVACAAAGPKAYIRHGENGMLAPIDDVPALSQAIQAVMDDPKLRSRIVDQGYADYKTRYTYDAVMSQWRAYYDDLASGR